MLTSEQFRDWCIKLNLSEQAQQQIQQIRSSPPSRRVQSRAGNVSGRYPSQKMGVTIQFESHHHELAGIYSMEYDSEVLEYYDQPPTIKLNYESASGRQLGVRHTPDYFVIRREKAGWEEWKTSQELERLAIKMPHRYQQTQSGQWQCPPGEAYAMQWGLEYRVRTETEIDWALQRNLYFLEDYFRVKTESESLSNQQKIMGLVETQPGITLLKLLEWKLNPDEIYSLIATKQLYVDLSAADLASEPEKVRLFLSIESATAAPQLSKSWNSIDKNPISQGLIQPTIGSQIVWDGIDWLVLNLGNTKVTLLNSQQKIVNLPLAVFEQLITQARLTLISPNSLNQSNVGLLIKSASESDCAEANRRYRIIAPYLSGSFPRDSSVPRRTFYRCYQADCSEDLVEFQRVLKSFGEKMLLNSPPEFVKILGIFLRTKYWLCGHYQRLAHSSLSQSFR
jgi:putative transposase